MQQFILPYWAQGLLNAEGKEPGPGTTTAQAILGALLHAELPSVLDAAELVHSMQLPGRLFATRLPIFAVS